MKRSRINPRSKRKQGEWREYVKIRNKYITENPYCHIKSPVCTVYTQAVHHRRHRGIYLSRVEYFAASCDACHAYIHANPKMSYENGWMLIY